jgi:rare lipoprotein A
MNRQCRLGWGLLVALLLAGCASQGPHLDAGADRDGPPRVHPDGDGAADAVPRVEPITRAGNKSPYTVLGKTYHLLPTAKGYREVGTASWYGTKFHGRSTSNGEPYDMFAMTAAHRTLPIPAYVRVTNLENGRSAIVRVNDRGPFRDNRIIDLSYAAARKLGVYDRGTARVEVVAIDPADYQRNAVEQPQITARARLDRPPATPRGRADGPPLMQPAFLQVGAFASLASARSLEAKVVQRVAAPTRVHKAQVAGRNLFRVLVGPFADPAELDYARNLLVEAERLNPFVVNGLTP